ncbi:MAG: hypothetical protein F6K58_17135 [Symploca sp. SIO2E9]|nr:hypothetical protein [Symploca sp. SIO2E9]
MARARDGSKSVQVSGKAAELLQENCDHSGLNASEFVKLLILSCSDVLMSRLFPNSSVHVKQSQVWGKEEIRAKSDITLRNINFIKNLGV